MSKFQIGSPQVTFYKKNGSKFTNTYHTRNAASNSIRAWRSKGGKVCCTGVFSNNDKIFRSKSGMTSTYNMRKRNLGRYYN